MGSGRWGWIVPDGLWEIAKPLLPPARVRPQGGGVANIDDEAVFAAIIYVLVSGCAWRALPPCFGASKSTVHRRFAIWSRAGVWGRLHQKVLQLLDERNLVDLSRAVLDSAHVRAKKGANLQVRAPWTGVGQVPRCTFCPTRTDCLYASDSPRPTPMTVRP
jgi:transposase